MSSAGEEVVGGRLDPSRSYFIDVLGKKGYGKSALARWIFDSYPYDRLVIDTTGDVAPGEDWRTVRGEIPERWPVNFDGKRITLRYVPDPTSPHYRDDLDRAVGLAFSHGARKGHVMLWCEEVHEMAPSGRTGPHMRRALRQGRHVGLTMLNTDIRPVTVDPLVLNQADIIYSFRIPNPRDRQAVADSIGWDLKEPIEDLDGESLDQVLAGLEKFHYARYVHEDDELVVFPPLPAPKKIPHADRSMGVGADV